jgi:hypothetical protein
LPQRKKRTQRATEKSKKSRSEEVNKSNGFGVKNVGKTDALSLSVIVLNF